MKLELNYNELKTLREALAQYIKSIPLIQQEEKYLKVEELYDKVSNAQENAENEF